MNKFFVKDNVYKDRLNICKSCVYFFELTGQCKRCLCFMKIKARIGPMECPEKYWQKTTEVEVPDQLPKELYEGVIEVWPDIEHRRAKNQEVKKRVIELYNTIYNTNYSAGTNCGSCLSSIYDGIKKIYEQYNE